MREKLINKISEKFSIRKRALLEKDIILHEILSCLCQDGYFSNNFTFKGGTCLIKAYLGYYRFSEDLDFTWNDQFIFVGKSHEGIERYTSVQAEQIGKLFEKIAVKFSLDFKAEKNNPSYFAFGGGGKMLTLFVRYESEIEKKLSEIKIQFNFVERICYDSELRDLSSLVSEDESLSYVFDNHTPILRS